jgi:alpha/beta superfamily hydrolase
MLNGWSGTERILHRIKEIGAMASTATLTTMIKMFESLPEPVQERVVEHMREYIEDIRDEVKWSESFSRTQSKLVAAARQARKEISEGKAVPMDPKKL